MLSRFLISTSANISGQEDIIAVASPAGRWRGAENTEQLHGDRAVRRNLCHNQMPWNQHFELKLEV